MSDQHQVAVWDPWVRLFHWSLVLLIAANLFVLESGHRAHRMVGYGCCLLVLLRILWGFAGTHHARFTTFWPTPRRVRAHLGHLLRGEHDDHPGHNPLGAIMIFGLLALVLLLGVTGWMMGQDAWFGDERIEALHGGLANVLLVAVGLHIVAAMLMSWLSRTNLIRAMITGVKTFPKKTD